MKRKKTKGTRRGCCRSYSPDFSTEGWYIFHDIHDIIIYSIRERGDDYSLSLSSIYNLCTAISSPILGNPFHKDFSIYTSFLLLSLIYTTTLFLGSSLFRTPCLSTRHQQRSHAVIPTEAPCDYSDGKWIYDQTVRSPPRYDSTCKEIYKGWNCLGSNKSNAFDIVMWRWKPKQCDLPQFDPLVFLQLYRNTNTGAHHLDLRAASNEDPTWLLEQREKEIKLIAGWIEAYNNRKGFGKI